MEDDAFSSSLSSLSTLSPQQGNYATLNANFANSSEPGQQQQQQQQQHITDSPINSDSSPYALFLFRSNNGLELFEERRINLDKPCKIGRSVAKIRPEPNNAIFDCKVLSRNHALMWEENGKV